MSHSFAKFVKNEESVDVTTGKYAFGLRDVNKIVVLTSVLKFEAMVILVVMSSLKTHVFSFA